MPETQELKGSEWLISLDKTRIQSLPQLIKKFDVDERIWEVERFICNKWEMGAKDKAGDIQKTELYQVKAWLKKRVNIYRALDEIESMKADASKYAPVPRPIIRLGKLTGNIAEISLADHHFGKLAWNPETGYGNYDVKIAVETWQNCIKSILHRLSPYKLDEIIFVLGNDLFHVDSRSNLTTAGTPQDTDVRYHKLFKIVRKVVTDTIDTLRMIAPVRVVVVPGNHDQLTAWHLGDSLECWYKNHNDVTIDNEPITRKYLRWGKVMLGWCHGDKGKKKSYPLLMATEQPDMWGKTVYREMHIGHLHTNLVDEQQGVRVRTLSSLSGTDYWHASNGYVGNIRSSEAFIWHKECGLVCSVVYNAPGVN